MSQSVRVAKRGESALSTDPNDFVFHSDYNTFKIIDVGTKEITLAASTANQSFTVTHLRSFIPLVAAFAKENSRDQIFLPNGTNVTFYGVKAGFSGSDVIFNYVSADADYITFNFDNDNVTQIALKVRYFILEKI